MKWFEYKQEVDALRAPDDLKARLLAMQDAAQPEAGSTEPRRAGAFAAAQPVVSSPAGKPAKRFPWKRALSLAACFALGVVTCGAVMSNALGWRMGSQNEILGGEYYASANSQAALSEDSTAQTYSVSDKAVGAADTAGGTVAGETVTVDQNETLADSQDTTQRMVIYTSSLSIESKKYDDTLAQLSDAVSAAGGYISNRDETNYGEDSRTVTLTCRIPADQYKSFLAAAQTSGSVTRRTENAEDITAEYIDVSAHVDALTAQRDRLLTLESQAGTLEDLLTIEGQLTDVQYQLDSYQQQLKWYQDQVSYCTVTVDVTEVQVYTPTQTGFVQRLASAFGTALTAFGTALGSILLWIVLRWPWLVLIAVIALAVWLYRRRRNSK